jgi:nicotinamidase-related amidase
MSEHVANNVALLVIDMQQALLSGAYRETEVVEVVNEVSRRESVRQARPFSSFSTTIRALHP